MMCREWAGAAEPVDERCLSHHHLSGVVCRMASGVERKLLGAAAQESNAAQVSDADEQIQIQRECFGAGKRSVATPVCVAEFDFVRSAGDKVAQ